MGNGCVQFVGFEVEVWLGVGWHSRFTGRLGG